MKKGTAMLLSTATLAVLGLGALGVSTTFASTDTSAHPRFAGLVHALATKFGVSDEEVQSVFDEQRAQMEADHAQKEAERLQEAVAAGDLTQEQADAILAKRDEAKALFESLKNLTPNERQASLRQGLEDAKVWAKEKEIPLRFLLPEMGQRGVMKGMHGFGERHHLGEWKQK